MKYFVDDKEVDITTLKEMYYNLDCCSTGDGWDCQELLVDKITEDEIHFRVYIRHTW